VIMMYHFFIFFLAKDARETDTANAVNCKS
jgi:hypothetical protein